MSDSVNTFNCTRAVVALGYFDSVHIGHRAVVLNGKKLADELSAELVVFTFSGDLRAAISGAEERHVYTTAERQELLLGLGADRVYFAPVDREFLSTSKRDFLDGLCSEFNVCGLTCGKDYRFGCGGQGDATYLEDYAREKGIATVITDTVLLDGQKVSTTGIKQLLSLGEITLANDRLGSPFFVTGNVESGRKVGRKIGFPTMNVSVDPAKQPLKEGVYAGYSQINGKKYPAIINYGGRPTYGLKELTTEVHLCGFEGDLYGNAQRVYFTAYMRDVKKFDTEEDLKRQLAFDRAEVLSGKYD